MPKPTTSARNDLVVHAATRPANAVAGVAVLVLLSGVLGAGAIGLLLALAVYAGLCVRSFHQEAPALASSRAPSLVPGSSRLDPGTLPEHPAVHIHSAHRTQDAVLEALQETRNDATYRSLIADITGMVEEMERTAQRARTVDRYVRSQDPAALQQRLTQLRRDGRTTGVDDLAERLKSLYRLQRRVEDYSAQLARHTSSLGTIATKVVELALMGQECAGEDLVLQARSLREQVEELQSILQEASA